MYPYLSDYLTLTSKATGDCVQIFDGCRTVDNAGQPGKAAGSWQFENPSAVWGGCCCWTWKAESYDPDVNPDPWFDPANPATEQVAGALVDPPDGSGNGFYLEPSISKRLFEEIGNTPLEMYATFTIVAATPQGERAWLEWFKRTVLDECTKCDGWTAEVRLECPCPPDDISTVVDANGDLLPVTAVDPQAPPEPIGVCGSTGPLEPWEGDLPVYSDLGVRQLLDVRFTGLEQLDDGPLWECGGNRWKICFEVTGREWFSEPVLQCTLGGSWDACQCLCDPITLCEPEPESDLCGPEPVTNQPVVYPPPTRIDTTDTVGGLICVPGRYARPEKFMLSACLTSPQPASATARIRAVIYNGASTVLNAKLLVWEAIEGVPRPDTQTGWATYGNIDPLFELPIIRLRPFEQIIKGADCSTTVLCGTGETHGGHGTVENPATCPPDMTCGKRYWVALQLPCDEAQHGALDLKADIYTVGVGTP